MTVSMKHPVVVAQKTGSGTEIHGGRRSEIKTCTDSSERAAKECTERQLLAGPVNQTADHQN